MSKPWELTDDEIHAIFAKIKHPNGPEDKVIAEHGFAWSSLKDFAAHKDWPLASKLAQALIDLGMITEEVVEREAIYRASFMKAERYIEEMEKK